MKTLRFVLLFAVAFTSLPLFAQQQTPLRIFIRAGEKTHGPGQHDHPQFLSDMTDLLKKRGAKAEGALQFPTGTQLDNTDVLVMFAAEAGTISPEQRVDLNRFTKRGGGLVIVHDAICGTDPQWFKTVVGGAWEHKQSKYFEGDVALYYQDFSHPITAGVSNFDVNDEIYWDLHLLPEARILAASYAPDKRNTREGRVLPSVYDIVPQMWVYEKDNYRAFVSILGHNHKTFSLPHYRAVLLRGIAWAGKREVDLLVSKDELASLRYPEGGPATAEKSLAQMKLHPEFSMSLVAAEPLVQKPISIDWDPHGRIWIAETPEYPAKADKDRPPRDRISILEDTNQDGVIDKKTVFHDGLLLPTSFVFHRDGVIVAQPPDIYFLRDTNHDGVSDKKETLFTGFGTMDTHAVLSNLVWGLDGWVYATVGYSRGDIKSGDGAKAFGKISDGVLRFKPDGSAIEQYSSKGSNTWGVDVAPDGEVFFSQANGDHLNHVVMSEAVLAKGKVGNTATFKNIEDHKKSFPIRDYTKQAYVQIDHVGGFTATSGCTIESGGAWPAKFKNTSYVAEPTVNLVHQDFLKPAGATYTASKAADEEFLASTDLWFRPIHQRFGPDGALYVLDFYNQAAVHNDTRGPKHGPNNAAVRPDRDHYFGRIWRVQHKQAKLVPRAALDTGEAGLLVKSLASENGWSRGTAVRLLVENGAGNELPAVADMARQKSFSPEARVSALWVLNRLGKLDEATLLQAAGDPDATVSKNALRMIAEGASGAPKAAGQVAKTSLDALTAKLNDPDARVKFAAIRAIGALDSTGAAAKQLVTAYPGLGDPWLQSAVLGEAAKDPIGFLTAAFTVGDVPGVGNFIAELSSQIAGRKDSALAVAAVKLLASPAATAAARSIALEKLAAGIKPESAPAWTPDLQNAFRALLQTPQAGLVIPLLAAWDKQGTMNAEIKTLVQQLTARLDAAGASDGERSQIVSSLIAVRQMNPGILPAVGKILGSASSTALQRQVLEALGNTADPGIGPLIAAAYPSLAPDLKDAAFVQVLKRADWSLAFVDAVKKGKIELSGLGPAAIHRLRTHSDKAVAAAAAAVIDEIRGPQIKEKNQLIAQLLPVVEKPGVIANGKELFTQNCAVCHKLNNEGNNLAPDLTGMGAHGPGELLVHVIDPNRVVEPNFIAYNIQTKDDQSFDGIIARENNTSVVIRDAAAETEIKKENIKSQQQLNRSLMPEGFEALGAEGLRDLIAYMSEGDSRFRLIDLKPVFSANSRKGIYISQDSGDDTLKFKKFGMIKVGDVPFEIANPAATTNGNNLLVLKGGEGVAKTMPQKVEINDIRVAATRLHFLGGVGGWAFPCCGDNKHEGLPVAKVTVQYDNGRSEEILLKNGVEFADYIDPKYEVPGSKQVPDLVSRGQVRWFTKPLQTGGTIKKITIESFDNAVAPTFVSVTAETAAAPAASNSAATAATAPTAKAPPPAAAPGLKVAATSPGTEPRVLIVGGGSSHDFSRWFDQADKATLQGAGAQVSYVDNPATVLPALKDLDVLYLSTNQPLPDAALKKGVFDFADAGKGLLLVHPALWYNWNDWPDYNRVLVGGGARSHDKFGEFEVTVEDPAHPVMAGVPKTFQISDELYHFAADAHGSQMKVLATGKSPVTGKTFPVIWITQHPKARVVCVTLGHDGKAHELPAFQTILKNSMAWAAGKTK